LAVRLVGESAPELAVGLGQVLGIATEPGGDRPRKAVAGRRGRHGLHEPHRDGLIPVQDVVRVDTDGALGGLGRDEGIAVPVTAHPGAIAHERGDARRSGPGPDGAATGRVERRVGRAVEAWHGREQGRVEHGHRGAHLVERLRCHRPQVRGPPQQRDLLAQPSADLAVLGRREARVVEALQQDGAATEGDERGASAGLGRMRGEDRADPKAGQHRIDLGFVMTGATEERDRLRDRVIEEPVAGSSLATPKRPNTPAGLRKVHELEVDREGRDDRFRGVQVERVQVGRLPFTVVRFVRPSKRDGPSADPLHRLVGRVPGLLDDDLAEQRPQEPHLAGQRVAGAC
jgi:hypothetical protein